MLKDILIKRGGAYSNQQTQKNILKWMNRCWYNATLKQSIIVRIANDF